MKIFKQNWEVEFQDFGVGQLGVGYVYVYIVGVFEVGIGWGI